MPSKKEKINKSIIILGLGQNWQNCPFDKEVWTLNIGVLIAKRVDKVFMFDPIERRVAVVQGHYTFNKKEGDKVANTKMSCSIDTFKDKINKDKIDFISAYAYPDIPTYRPYPIREIKKEFGLEYFANTICYMIAYAIYTGVKSIDFWGVTLSSSNEYILEKPCVEFWIGMAVGMGIQVSLLGDSPLLNNYEKVMYGYRLPYEHLEQKLKGGELIFKQ